MTLYIEQEGGLVINMEVPTRTSGTQTETLSMIGSGSLGN